MSQATLEDRVTRLEAQIKLLQRGAAGSRRDWRSMIGAFTGDDGMRQVFEEAMKVRQADRKKVQRRRGTRAGRGKR